MDWVADKLPAEPGVANVRFALLPTLSLIVPEFKVRDDVPT